MGRCNVPVAARARSNFWGSIISMAMGHSTGAKCAPAGIYRWLIKHKFPSGIQILCHNCNLAKGYYGSCPHQDPDGANPAK